MERFPWMKTTERAHVGMPGLGGQGTLIPGRMILTACRCIEWSGEGYQTVRNVRIEKVGAHCGTLSAVLVAAEPVTDVAVLGEPDGQTFYEEWQAFDEFCESTEAIPLAPENYTGEGKTPVWVYALGGEWIEGVVDFGEAKVYGNPHQVWLRTKGEIRSGSAGGPILNAKGEIVAVVSTFGRVDTDDQLVLKEDGFEGLNPRPSLCLPAFVLHRIAPASGD